MSDQTPLYSALVAEAGKKTLRMHMPGHKGKALGAFKYSDIFEIDFTELRTTGNLYEGVPPISEAEELAAKAAKARDCFFMTGGSTQAIMTAMATACKPGSRIIIDRSSHRSVWNAMVHLDLRPSFLFSDMLAPWNIAGPISAPAVEEALAGLPEASAVVITSPSYFGVLSDISGIAEVTKKYRVPLIVDEAHGAHLPYIAGYGCAVGQGAQLSAASAHKTLPALTSGAFLFSDGTYGPVEIRRKAVMFGTSSPSYPIMASMDAARAYMEGEGGRKYERIAQAVRELRGIINSGGCFRALEEGDGFRLDPARLTVDVSPAGLSGYQAAEILESEFNIVCEMADKRNIVLIITCADTEDDLDRFLRALTEMERRRKKSFPGNGSYVNHESDVPAPPVPIQRVMPREAAYARREYVRLGDAEGRIAGENIAPYPPGIPVVAAGEELSSAHIGYLELIGFKMNKVIAILA